MPRAGVRAVRAFLQKELQPWTMRWEEDFLGIPAAARAEAAAVVGARPGDISLTSTTSSGLVTVAQGYPWHPGDEVLAPLGEFPSNAWPWLALQSRGVSFREASLWEGQQAGASAWASRPPTIEDDLEGRLIAALGPRTRVLTLSWVRFQDGLKLDLPRLSVACRERGVHLVVDGIQGAGTAPVQLEGVSAFATGGYKGLLAPEGLGFLWTDEAFRQSLSPSGSWLSVEEATDFSRPSTDFNRAWLADGRVLEPGGPNLLQASALVESLRLLNEAGVTAIADHIALLQERLLEDLRGSRWSAEVNRLLALLRAGRLGSILAFHHGNLGMEGLNQIMKSGYRQGLFTSVREGYLRVAFHGYHTEADVDRVAAWLDRVSGTTS
ncbi:aminotransferase class V-fold PLP-dependent enzyme [Geothrix sp. PMB-07]|uniref:aminotransferase class V-fold PLP-dependent enzyme n=1 Tax=Geothrix sp. PMB-07 TaxID=3068640 RepID=UPI002740F5F2|nr:aminotransferase class V-fold PLP-dependent enzyme [Geothrix sp. PMB-07]WLT31764.1 aminotransferase class V-fold PLP-dependent enzyme [Geothrix sp. PMB-07]